MDTRPFLDLEIRMAFDHCKALSVIVLLAPSLPERR
jgi:hypothetical protein